MALIDIEIPRWSIDLIYGNTGSGKSFFTGWLIEQAYEQGRRFIILDTKVKNHIGLVALKGVKLLKIKPNVRYDFSKLVNYDQLLVIPTKGLISKIGVDGLIEYYYKPILNELFKKDRDKIIVVEEAHRYNPSSRTAGKELEQLFREGRDAKLYTIAITQSIADFPKLLFRQAQRHFIFKHYIPNDLFYLSKMIPDFEELNNQLRQHDVLEFNPKSMSYRIIRREYIIRRTRHYG
ncbi:helicase HerA domain-containing protein [Thermococcus barophilus]|uniref:Putative ATPase, AAA superfamily n=1 Tax=Thermococcus barophilus TaxID=55802 RepID=A0A0S1XF71_THEBA|nr:DUF87 domain-containing protein [Thermococcus barophilus]ALM76474.1 putative ATPase, AAA superfamily [Thermococcus barophilus]